jgi:hypothetical protein
MSKSNDGTPFSSVWFHFIPKICLICLCQLFNHIFQTCDSITDTKKRVCNYSPLNKGESTIKYIKEEVNDKCTFVKSYVEHINEKK